MQQGIARVFIGGSLSQLQCSSPAQLFEQSDRWFRPACTAGLYDIVGILRHRNEKVCSSGGKVDGMTEVLPQKTQRLGSELY